MEAMLSICYMFLSTYFKDVGTEVQRGHLSKLRSQACPARRAGKARRRSGGRVPAGQVKGVPCPAPILERGTAAWEHVPSRLGRRVPYPRLSRGRPLK